MQYRQFGKLDFKVSALGFGAMRLPVTDTALQIIDEKEAAKMIHYAIEHGVNYIDTAYYYQNNTNEIIIGNILKQNNYRHKVKIATKLPCWLVTFDHKDPDELLNEQLKKLQTDHIDFYLLHALFGERWQEMKGIQILEWAEKAIRDGRIGHLGFSFHDSFGAFKEIVDDYDKWEFCYIQYNYMNENVQAGKKGLEYAAIHGIPVVVMEPLLGGRLANLPGDVQDIFDEYQASPVDIALRWLWNQPEVACVLSGMTATEQVEKNVAIAEKSGINTFSAQEEKLVNKARELLSAKAQIPCTKCRYCLPCPNSVDIPFILELYNEFLTFQKHGMTKDLYSYHIPDQNKATSCTQCRLCESKCPQKIKISEWMPIIHEELLFK